MFLFIYYRSIELAALAGTMCCVNIFVINISSGSNKGGIKKYHNVQKGINHTAVRHVRGLGYEVKDGGVRQLGSYSG